MIIKKVFNNNVLLAEGQDQLEYILVGQGIGFQKKVKDVIDEKKVEKTFVLNSKEVTHRFIELINKIPVNHLQLSNKIIEQAEDELGVKFNDSIYIGLADHINYAITRYKQGEQIKNVLLWEIKKFYKKEYQAAKKALKLIKYEERITLEDDEAGFIALHFVNAQQQGEEMHQTVLLTEIVEEILKIVQFHYAIRLDEQSLNYSRFVTHIRYFVRRLLANELSTSEDEFLYEQIKEKYPKSYDCAIKVKRYLSHRFEVEITKEEMVYFMLHINRMTQKSA